VLLKRYNKKHKKERRVVLLPSDILSSFNFSSQVGNLRYRQNSAVTLTVERCYYSTVGKLMFLPTVLKTLGWKVETGLGIRLAGGFCGGTSSSSGQNIAKFF